MSFPPNPHPVEVFRYALLSHTQRLLAINANASVYIPGGFIPTSNPPFRFLGEVEVPCGTCLLG